MHGLKRMLAGALSLGLVVSAMANSGEYSEDLGVSAARVALIRQAGWATDPADGMELIVDADRYRDLRKLGSAVVTQFPLPGMGPVDLALSSFRLLSPGARFVAVDERGEHDVPTPDLTFFRGSVEGDPGSLVTLTLFEGRIAGFVRTSGEEFDFRPQQFDRSKPGADRIVIRNRRDEKSTPDPLPCGADWAAPRGTDRGRPVSRGGIIDGDTVLEAGLAVDATVEWYQEFGSLPAAQNYILNLLAQVSTIYESEVNVQLEVPYLRVFTAEPDPYPNGETSSSALLPYLRNEWNANQTGVSRTAVHLFSAKSSGGNGYAYIDVLCSNNLQPGNSYDYGTTIMSPGSSWETWLVAHELGHNFGSPHTHCYVPEIDRCATESGCYQGSTQQTLGTIMSYCNNKINAFHPRVKDERIRPAVEEAFPTCVQLAGNPAEVPTDALDGLRLSRPAACPEEILRNDDGSFNNVYSISGTAQGAFIKRFTPGCYPFQVDRIEFLPGASPSIGAGRPIRLLVFSDPSGSGDPTQSTLVYTEDTTLQTPSYSVFNSYDLATPVTAVAGDLYLGYYDLLPDAGATVIAIRDNSVEGDSYRAATSTSPENFTLTSGGTWMIRGHGGPIGADSVSIEWGVPCNLTEVPGQDFAVYRGDLGDFGSHRSLTCSTARNPSYVAVGAASASYFLVVPVTGAKEGSYGRGVAGAERLPAALPCKPQQIDACP